MTISSQSYPVPLACSTCGCRFVRPLKEVGWENVIACPDSGTPLRLDAGENARSVERVGSIWMRDYQRHHFPDLVA